MIQVKKGDLLENAEQRFDVIVHGCNCFNNMGAGIAKSIKEKYPEAYRQDQKTKEGDKEKLGTITVARYGSAKPFYVVNAYTQFKYGGGGRNADYDAIRSCMKRINEVFPGKHIGLPKIGAGLAKGDWSVIEKIIEDELTDVTYEVWTL